MTARWREYSRRRTRSGADLVVVPAEVDGAGVDAGGGLVVAARQAEAQRVEGDQREQHGGDSGVNAARHVERDRARGVRSPHGGGSYGVGGIR
ncbi:hypothetical protein DEH69_23070 [Streptomyces sp. PT12]|nr:hypothetical protein DEH69_23070 [Streptomyces sp. PT12]